MILRSARPAATFKDGLIRHSVGEIHRDYVGQRVLEIQELAGTHIDILKDVSVKYAGRLPFRLLSITADAIRKVFATWIFQ